MPGFNDRIPGAPAPLISQTQSIPRISYYISRTNGTLIPLVPVDELPRDLRLQGLPRTLNSDQVFGLQHVSMLPYTGLTFRLEQDTKTYHRSSDASCASSAFNIDRNSDGTNQYTSDSLAAHPSVRYNLSKEVDGASRSKSSNKSAESWRTSPASNPQAIIDAIVGTKSGAEATAKIGYQPKPSTSARPGSIPEKKEYCSYWLRNGECDFMQQGCRYKHEMPDKATLEKLGFRSTPRWWREKNQNIRLSSRKAVDEARAKLSARLESGDEHDVKSNVSNTETSDGQSSGGNSLVVEFTPYRKKENTAEMTSNAVSTMAAPALPIQELERKQSIMSDLIDFDPLTPTPSSSTSHSESSMSESDGGTRILPATGRCALSEEHATSLSGKVFTPRSENFETCVAEVEKMDAQNRKKRSSAKARVNSRANTHIARVHEAWSRNYETLASRMHNYETIASKIHNRDNQASRGVAKSS